LGTITRAAAVCNRFRKIAFMVLANTKFILISFPTPIWAPSQWKKKERRKRKQMLLFLQFAVSCQFEKRNKKLLL
jgi:hypothetical protein